MIASTNFYHAEPFCGATLHIHAGEKKDDDGSRSVVPHRLEPHGWKKKSLLLCKSVNPFDGFLVIIVLVPVGISSSRSTYMGVIISTPYENTMRQRRVLLHTQSSSYLY